MLLQRLSILLAFFFVSICVNAQHYKTVFKVHYIQDSITLTPYSHKIIQNKLSSIPVNNEITHVNLVGYTDSTGSKEANEMVALMRAQNVRDLLVEKGVSVKMIEVSGIGEAKFIASNETERGRLLNRRTEIIIHYRPTKEVLKSDEAVVIVEEIAEDSSITYSTDTIESYSLDSIDKIIPADYLYEKRAKKLDYETYADYVNRIIPRRRDSVKTLVVTDWTRSMYPYGSNVFKWHLNNLHKSSITYMAFFNDGDYMKHELKDGSIGEVGGIYFGVADSVSDIIRLMDTVAKASIGGDYPENVIEVMFAAENNYLDVDTVVLIADNRACIRDYKLMEQLGRPIHILLNEVDGRSPVLNHQYVNLAAWTGGSVSVMGKKIEGLSFEDNRIAPIYYTDTLMYMPKVKGNLKAVRKELRKYKKQVSKRSLPPIISYNEEKIPTDESFDLVVDNETTFRVGVIQCKMYDQHLYEHVTCKPTYTFVQKLRIGGKIVVYATVGVVVTVVALPVAIVYTPIKLISSALKGKKKSKSKKKTKWIRGPKMVPMQ